MATQVQDEGTQAAPESQVPELPPVTEIDPDQLRIRHLQINARRRRKLTWATVAKRIGVHETALSQALGKQYPPDFRRRQIRRKVDRFFTRIEKDLMAS